MRRPQASPPGGSQIRLQNVNTLNLETILSQPAASRQPARTKEADALAGIF
jgi:hypothetical protein